MLNPTVFLLKNNLIFTFSVSSSLGPLCFQHFANLNFKVFDPLTTVEVQGSGFIHIMLCFFFFFLQQYESSAAKLLNLPLLAVICSVINYVTSVDWCQVGQKKALRHPNMHIHCPRVMRQISSLKSSSCTATMARVIGEEHSKLWTGFRVKLQLGEQHMISL